MSIVRFMSKKSMAGFGAIATSLGKCASDRKGVAAVVAALALTVLIGVVALGVETGLWYAIKRQDQSAADAAAISGAYEVAAGQGYSDICALAERDAATNGFTFQSLSWTPEMRQVAKVEPCP
jgi:Flp pilus assembly protein TadG